jgi:putative ABC transport system permease protein
MFDTVMHDVRYALRSLRRSPGFAAAAILTLALGIGANTAIFSVVEAVLLRSLPYRDADRIVVLWAARGEDKQLLAAYTDVMEWRTRARTLEDIGVMRGMSVNLTGRETPERLGGEFVSASVFSVMGARAGIGRLFTAEETTPGTGQAVAVLSDAAWRTRFGADRGIVGRSILLNNVPHVVVGVMAPEYQTPVGATDVWLPITSIPSRSTFDRGVRNVWAVGKLRPGLAPEAAQRDLNDIARRLAAESPATNAGIGVTVVPLREQVAGAIRPALLTLLVAVAAVLLIACANVANLQLARAAVRRHEISVRVAMGAGGGRLVRQLFTESLVLAAIGGGLGVLLAVWGLAALVGAVPGGLPAFGPVGIDLPVLAFSAALTLVAGAVFGLAPSWHAARTGPGRALRVQAAGAAEAPGWFDLRSTLVAAELALCIVLLVGAGLLTRSVARLRAVDPGFAPDHLLTFQFRLPPSKYDTPDRIAAFFAAAADQVRAVPGVRAAAFVSATPFSGNWGSVSYEPEGRPAAAPGQEPEAYTSTVSGGYFATMRIPVLEGRDFSAADRRGALPVTIVSRELARREWPGASGLGRRVREVGDSVWYTVVGVVGDTRQLTLGEPLKPFLYLPIAQSPFIFSNVVARTSGDPLTMTPAVRGAIWAVDRDQPVWSIRSMDDLLARSVSQLRFTMMLTGAFAGLALILGAVGVYGVMSYVVAQRTREVGIRLAVGARPAQVVRQILARGARVTLVAVVVGLVAALGASRLLASQLFGIRPDDPPTYAAVALVLGAVALLACWVPARRAARVDPVIALRAE